MNKNEQNFINYYFRNVVGQKVNAKHINEAHFILRGERVTDDCNACIKNRKQKLDNTYISLIKTGGPEPIFEIVVEDVLTDEIVQDRIKQVYPDKIHTKEYIRFEDDDNVGTSIFSENNFSIKNKKTKE